LNTKILELGFRFDNWYDENIGQNVGQPAPEGRFSPPLGESERGFHEFGFVFIFHFGFNKLDTEIFRVGLRNILMPT